MRLPPGARQHSDGTVTFPMRGKPPVCDVPGYVVDENDAYRWIMTYDSCKHRELQKRVPCEHGRIKIVDFCNLLQLPINPATCRNCQSREE